MYRAVLLTLMAGFAAPGAGAAELKILPADIALTGPNASQRVLVVSETAGMIDGDHTARSRFTSSNPAVATVDEGGVVRVAGDGEAVITAFTGGQQATARVRATQARSPVAWSFTNHVIPVLTRNGCNSGACHGALAGKGGFKLSLRGFAPAEDHFVLTRQALGRRVNLLEPAQSLMLRKPTMAVSHGGGLKLEVGSPEYQLLADWIASGAPGPRGDEANIRRLEVFPPAATLKPADTMQVVVRAWYSDGRSQDVTRWAKFSSTEDLVAAVDENGKARVAGNGEATISVWYSNLVASCRITSPMPNAIDPKVFARASRQNYIDDLVLKKLGSLHIPPSPNCSDAEFIRRVYLDAAGILPTPEEVTRLLSDKVPDRRARLIDALLERPEFVDYWTYKWSDLLLISTRKLPQPAVWAFHQFVRQSVADNKPWDQFAREILTARGNNLQHGEANYFVLHKDLSDLTEATAVTFLGMSVTCCRCHNHPLEKWTQDQYWSMANLFARVALKNGDRTDEVTVLSQPTGEALHPRRAVPLPPAPLDARPLPLDSSIDRRQYFVDWLTAPENPYFARALVNRVAHNYLGRGLVEAEDDLRQTNPPSNEELFEALARDFVAHRYDVKHLMRTILNSATYQRSSTPVRGNEKDDRFYSHYLIRRLPAEVILDAYSQVTNVPTVFNQLLLGSSGGVQRTNAFPPGTRALQLPDPLIVSPFLDAFGRPERSQTCSCERQQESSVTQALHLDNGKTLNEKLRAKNSRVEQWVKEKVSDEEAIRRVYLLALSRSPSATERQRFNTLLTEAARDPLTTRREALEDLFWAVLTGREFLFNR
jgi:hypothetical protein